MKIFYGVQGTGNGHITRGRMMAKALYAQGFDVDFQFTGRPEEQYFDMEVFKDYQCRAGLTFHTEKGQVYYLKTAMEAKPLQFIKDVKRLDLSAYDLVISDFEPVTAWAARRQKKNILGIGHQYAFNHNIPRADTDPIANQVMKYFAPVTTGVGLHWHHFGQPILPPVINTPDIPENIQQNKIVVYLPFEAPELIIDTLSSFKNFEFYIYSPEPMVSKHSHIRCHPLSFTGFQKDVYDCVGIISNAGFELASEALQLGKKLLAKPLHAQMEQLANAQALKELGYGETMFDMEVAVIDQWLHESHAIRITYPNVADILVDWIKEGMPEMDANYIEQVWSQVEVLKINEGLSS